MDRNYVSYEYIQENGREYTKGGIEWNGTEGNAMQIIKLERRLLIRERLRKRGWGWGHITQWGTLVLYHATKINCISL